MRRSQFTEEQIAFSLKQSELGAKVEEISRKMGISDATFYKWRQKYGGLGPSGLRRLRQLEEENNKLKRLVADLSLDKSMLQTSYQKRSDAFAQTRTGHRSDGSIRASMRKAWAAIQISRVVYLYNSVARDNMALAMQMKEITRTRVHNGYRRVHVMLKREGFKDNHKRVYRLYREKGMSLRQPKTEDKHINQIWSMDFVADNLFDGRKLRMLTVVDCYSRESLATHVGQSLKGDDVVRVLNVIVRQRGKPQTIKTGNGSESSPRPWTDGPINVALNWTSAD